MKFMFKVLQYETHSTELAQCHFWGCMHGSQSVIVLFYIFKQQVHVLTPLSCNNASVLKYTFRSKISEFNDERTENQFNKFNGATSYRMSLCTHDACTCYRQSHAAGKSVRNEDKQQWMLIGKQYENDDDDDEESVCVYEQHKRR